MAKFFLTGTIKKVKQLFGSIYLAPISKDNFRLQAKRTSKNGVVKPDADFYGLSEVTVEVEMIDYPSAEGVGF